MCPQRQRIYCSFFVRARPVRTMPLNSRTVSATANNGKAFPQAGVCPGRQTCGIDRGFSAALTGHPEPARMAPVFRYRGRPPRNIDIAGFNVLPRRSGEKAFVPPPCPAAMVSTSSPNRCGLAVGLKSPAGGCLDETAAAPRADPQTVPQPRGRKSGGEN